jgi:hypothetical protein
MNMNLTVVNNGVMSGTLVDLVGTITRHDDNKKASFRWNSFIENTNLAKPGEKIQPWFSWVGFVESIAVPGRTAVVKNIVSITDTEFTLGKGSYKIEFVGTVAPAPAKWLMFKPKADEPLPTVKAAKTFHISGDKKAQELDTEEIIRNSQDIFEAAVSIPFD